MPSSARKSAPVFFLCLLEAAQRIFVSDAVVLIPIVPGSADENFRLRYLKPVAELGLAVDPRSIFAKNLFDFADGDGDGMFGDVDAVPGFADHLLVVHQATRILDEHLECTEGPRP